MKFLLFTLAFALSGCAFLESMKEVAENPEVQEGAKEIAEGAGQAVAGDYVGAAAKIAAGVATIVLVVLGVKKVKQARAGS